MAFAIWNRTIQDEQGNVQGGASVEVRDSRTNALATLYSNREGTTLKTNPFLTDVNGYAFFFAVGGAYNVTASKGAYQMTFPYEAVGTSAETDFEQLAQMLESGVFPFQTVAQMNAFTPPSSPSAAVVYTGAASGYYNWTGTSWSYSRALPDTFARLVVTGGTANAPVAAVGAGVNPSSPTVFFIDGVTPNTGSVTLTVTGLGSGLVRNAAGGALSAGEWQGRIFFTQESNGEFKIVNDPASALAAAQSATLAGTRATAASNSASAAAGSATAAGNSATAAAGSATTASTQAGNAAGSASAAAGSASAASTSAGNAAGSATTATNQAGAAATSASNASGSATAAGTQATNAANSASAAATQAGAALTQANRAEDEADRAEAAASSVPTDSVRYGAAQSLTAPQQTQARTNIGLGNVDNTSDANKPVSTATQTALSAKVSITPQTLTSAQQAQARQNIQADHAYDTIAIATAATVPAYANAIRTNGYYDAGDGGGALYKRVATEPSHAGKMQSADGAWWELSERDVTVEMFGGVGSMTVEGVPSLSDIIPSLSDAVIYQNMRNGGKIYLTCKYYKQMTQFVFGNGSATQSSTINGIEIYGKSGKVTDAEFDASKSHGTTFQWYGPQSENTLDSQVSILGPLNSCVIQDITFDGRGLRSTIFKANMMYFCRIVGVHCINWWFRGWHLETYSADYPIPGFSQWFFSNTFERCVVRMPVYGGPQEPHCAAWMGGDTVKNVGFSRNHFILCDFGTPDGDTSIGLYLAMIDNNTFDRCFVFYDNGEPTGDGKGVYMERCGPDMYGLNEKFPCDNIFLNCPVFGGYHGASGTAGNLVIGYPTVDLQPEPNMDYLYVISCDGRMYGNMRGSAVQWAGAVTPSGLGGTSAYLSPVGYGEPQQWADDAELIIPGDAVISVFTVSLGVAPGPGATRKFTIFKNGVATAVSITFTSSQQGVQTWTYSNGILNSGIKFNRGDLVTIQSEVTGTPVNAKCKFSIELLPR